MPDDARDPSDDDDSSPHGEDGPPDDDDSPPDSDDGKDDEADVPIEGDDPEAPRLDPAIVRRFLNTKQALGIAKTAVRKMVPKNQVDDLAADALVCAVRALPPHLEVVLPGWLTIIAERRAIRWLAKRKRRAAYEGPMPTRVAREDDYTGEAVETADPADRSYDPQTDAAPAKLLGEELDEFIGDHARDLEVRAMIREHSDDGKSYADIAAARGLTPAQVANRILRFKAKYTARVQRRRQFLFVLKALKLVALLAAAGAAIVLAWYLLHRVGEDIRPDPSPSLTPSASASAPVFLQALPPTPDPTLEPPGKKPKPPLPPRQP